MTNIERLERKSRPWWVPYMSRQPQFALDILVLVAAFILAYHLRFDFELPRRNVPAMLIQTAYVVPIQFGSLFAFSVYTFIWRYVGISEMGAFVRALLWAALPVVVLRLVVSDDYPAARVPLSVITADTVLAFAGVFGMRVLRRSLYEHYEKRLKSPRAGGAGQKPVLLIGAGRAGVMTAREILSRGDSNLDVKGFVDDDPGKAGSVIHGVGVLGTTHDLPRLAAEYGIDHAVITMSRAPRHEFRRILDLCEQIPLKVRIIPGFHELINGAVKASRIRDLQIEDLLGREPVQLNKEELRDFISGKTVMVTGAGGSIGSEIARQLTRFGPASLLLVERAESALFNIERELLAARAGHNVVPLLADVSDRPRMESIYAAYGPQVVLHAAAHKHVPMMECNAVEAVKNNVLATHLLADLAGRYGVEVFVQISTDKAVCPTSVMGASKRVAELVIQDLNRSYQTRFVAVRFGNVIGSAGSVIPIFQEQIRRGGPVTVTHPDMVRYFMTIPEAVQLVLQSGAMGEGGEIFILDMGEPVRILDIAEDTIRLSGLQPYHDIEVAFTGQRPGEKLFEELETSGEAIAKTRHPKIYIGKIAAYPHEQVRHAVNHLAVLAKGGFDRELRRFINELLPEARLSLASEAPGVLAAATHSGGVERRASLGGTG
jgi:FlaA1/EpsC-like NDP-sugar epimerase